MSELKPRITENGIDYILVGDYYIPDLKLPEEHRPIGKYGRIHREYLREVHPARLNTLILTGELWTYLADLNEQAQERLDTIMEQMKAAEGVTEELKRTRQMEWVQQVRIRCPLRKERLNGVCDRSQRFDPCKIQSLIRADQAAAGLLRRCAPHGRTALFFGPELSFQQCSGPADDFCHAAGAAVRSVRAARPAP